MENRFFIVIDSQGRADGILVSAPNKYLALGIVNSRYNAFATEVIENPIVEGNSSYLKGEWVISGEKHELTATWLVTAGGLPLSRLLA